MSLDDSQHSEDARGNPASDDDRQPARAAFHRHKVFFTAAAVLACYVSSYSILSVNGEYRSRPSGEYRYEGIGLAILDLHLWCPAAMHWERRKSVSGEYIIDADPLGWFYLPMIKTDRAWFHPTTSIFDASH